MSMYFFYGSTLLVALVVFAQLTRFEHWMIRAFDFPVRQFLVLEIIASILFFAFGEKPLSTTDWIVVGLGLISSGYLCYTVWPYSFLHKKDLLGIEEGEGQLLSILSANVYMQNTDYGKLKDLIKRRKPDMVLLLETDSRWAVAMEDLKNDYPYTILHPLENTYGLLFYSKIPFQDEELRFLLKSDIPSIKLKLKMPSGSLIQFYGVHPEPPAPGESKTSEPRDIELLKLAKEIKPQEMPVIVSGDLNDVAWSHTTRLFRRFSGLLDPRIGRGAFNTFHVKYPLLRWPLDHIFVSKHFALDEICVEESIGSDHFPIYVSFQLNQQLEQPTPENDESDEEEVEEKLEKESEYDGV